MNLSSTTTLEYEYWKFFGYFFYHSSTCCNTQYQRARVLRPFRISNSNRVSNRIQQWWRRLLPLASHWILNTTSASTVGSSEGLCKNLTRQSSSLVRKKLDSCISLEGHANRKCNYSRRGPLSYICTWFFLQRKVHVQAQNLCNWYDYNWATTGF